MSPDTPTPALDRDAVQRLVAEVIRRIHAESPRPASPAAPASPAVPSHPAVSSYGAPDARSGIATLADKVVTLAVLQSLPRGSRQVVVDARAVVTPAARDHAKESGLAIVRATATTAGAVPVRPFFVAHAQCAGDPVAKAAAIARAVPGAQQLPPSGLADLVAALATHASRDAARGILLSSRPALAATVANRSASLRAVTARDPSGLAAAAAECQANLLVVDPASFQGGLERACAEFAGRVAGPLPSELAAAAPGCGCKNHPH